MYSPKIRQDLIPVLYKLAKLEGKSMTTLIDEMLRTEISKRNGHVNQTNDDAIPASVKKTAEDGGS